MTAADRRRANAALLPTVRQLLDMQASGYRGQKWHAAFARLRTTVDLIDPPKGTPDA